MVHEIACMRKLEPFNYNLNMKKICPRSEYDNIRVQKTVLEVEPWELDHQSMVVEDRREFEIVTLRE